VRRQSYAEYLRGLPALFLGQAHLGRLVLARLFGSGFLMVVAFLTSHALHLTGRPEADEGMFVIWQAVGTVLGSLLAGWIGYWSGGRLLLISSRLVCMGLCVALHFTQSFGGFMAAYFVLGFGLFLDRVGDLTLGAELCASERRTTLQAMLSFGQMLSLLIASQLGSASKQLAGSFTGVLVCAALCAAISIYLLSGIPEPRRRVR
jgi:MFS family permease